VRERKKEEKEKVRGNLADQNTAVPLGANKEPKKNPKKGK